MKHFPLLIANAALVSLVGSCDTEIQKEKPNVLFIAVNDLRPELGCYDNDPEENLNLADLPEYKGRVSELSQLLREHRGEDFFAGQPVDYSSEQK